MSWTRKWLKLTFQSDWHIGSGAGIPGSVDRQVLRDEGGFPYVPGKTLTGILRDAAEFVAGTRGGRWEDVLNGLFGDQTETHGGREGSKARGAKIGAGSAELDGNIRKYLLAFSRSNADLNIIAPLFSVHPGVKIDRETGRAMDDHLFSTERARRDCVLYAPVLFMEELNGDERKLLDDAVKAVRHIGGKRRRGAGECRLAWDDEYKAPRTQESTPQPAWERGAGGSVTLDIRLKTLQPLIVARKTLGNVVQSENEIPGATLLSYYTEKVLSPLGKDRLTKAVMDGEISISAFLPEFGGEAAMPVPLCLGELKEEKSLINRLVTPPDGKKQVKDLRTGYVTVSGGGMIYHSGSSQRVIRTHNTIDDAVQRPTEDVGGLFTYEAIRSGQTFRGTLRIGAALWDEIEKSPEKGKILSRLAHDRHRFGRSRKDEYGDAELFCVSTKTGEGPGSTALLDGRDGKANGKYLVVYLLSDLLLRGEYQGCTVRLDDVRNALSDKLGVGLEDIPPEEWEEKGDFDLSPLGGTRGHCVRAVRRESWQRNWALPRPSLVFLKAGSVLVFKVKDPENWTGKEAGDLMRDGLGERRAEGYGRVLLNPPFLRGKNIGVDKAGEGKPPSAVEVKLPEREEARDFVLKLVSDAGERHFRQIARREVYDIVKGGDNAPFASHPDVRWDAHPTASQFGALREAAAYLGGTSGTGIFKGWVQAISREDRKENPWEKPWRGMLKAMAGNPEVIWGLRPAFEKFRAVFPEELKEELLKRSEALLGVFLDLLCEAVFDDEKRKEQEAGK